MLKVCWCVFSDSSRSATHEPSFRQASAGQQTGGLTRVNLNKLLKHVMSATFQPIGATASAHRIPIGWGASVLTPPACHVQLSTKKPIKLGINCAIVATTRVAIRRRFQALLFSQSQHFASGEAGFLRSPGVSLFIVAAGRKLFALHSPLMHANWEIFAI